MLTTADRRETDFRRKPLWGEQSESKDTESTEEFENNSLTDAIIGAAISVHRELGPGLLESTYEKCLAFELSQSGLQIAAQKEIPIKYKGQSIESGFRADLIVENKVLIELKSVDQLIPVHTAQVLNYLKLTGLRTGLLINFNVQLLKNGIKRLSL
jgi:GxxExxY protein